MNTRSIPGILFFLTLGILLHFRCEAATPEELSTEIQALKTEMKSLKDEVKELKGKTLVLENLEDFRDDLLKQFKPGAQKIFEAYGLKGAVLDYDIDRPYFEKGVLYFRQRIVWQNEDLSGGGVAIISGLDLSTEKFTYDKIIDQKTFSKEEMREAGIGIAASLETPPSNPSTQKEGFYARNQKQIDSAAVGIGAVAVGTLVKHWLNSMLVAQ